MRKARLDHTTGHLSLDGRTGESVLLPRMTLHQFARTPVAKCFRKGFERRHFAYNGHFIGTFDFGGVAFNILLGFESPSTLRLPESCCLEGLSLFPCNWQEPSSLLERGLAMLGWGGTSRRPLTEEKATACCRQWLWQSLKQDEDVGYYVAWGSVRFVAKHPYYGSHVCITYAT